MDCPPEGWTFNPARDSVFQSAPSNPPPSGTIGGGSPQAVTYGPVYNMGSAGNIFSGVNHGLVIMSSDSNEFITNLSSRLKVSVKAEYRYYACGDEKALRRSSCTPGTRVVIIGLITRWALDTSLNSEPVYWLSGQAGSGKTTIAYTVACQFETLISDVTSRVVLGGSFFCSRQFPDTRSASSLVRTIVYQLALRSKSFQSALKEHGRFETVDHGPESQLMGLLVEPWRMSAAGRLAGNEPCYVIPIDALDELDGTGGMEFLGTLLDVLERQNLPGLKFIITSRSDPALVKRINAYPNKQVCRLEEVPIKESNADIKLYLNQNLAHCANDSQIQKLVSDAGGLFIYAATVVEYVKGRDVEEQRSLLKRLLTTPSPPSHRRSRGATATLDNLYLQILEASLVDPRDRDDPDVFEDCLSILRTFLCTNERTSTSVAVDILNASTGDGDMVLDAGTANGVLHRLHAVLYTQGSRVMWFHKSLPDFLFDKRRSQQFFCSQEQHHRRLADGCFRIMKTQLRFNIADIPSSYQLDSDDLMLSTRITANISPTLKYACRNWSAHVTLACLQARAGLVETLNEFLQIRILFWMESMNLLGRRGSCQAMLRDVQRWLAKFRDAAELVSMLADAVAFATYHSTSRAALSTPHLYLSSLATFSRRSAIAQTWRRQLGGIPKFIGAKGVDVEALLHSIDVGGEVKALAVAPDGTNVAVGTRDGLVPIWDLSTGEEVRVLKGHPYGVSAVAYSPDGASVISGAYDHTVRVWDLSTGEEERIFKGHSDAVLAVAYLPDGNRVVSGSKDASVRVWELSTGHAVKVLGGHTAWVWAVACSPDGTRVVAGSGDNFLRLWDLCTGQEVMVLRGHTNMACAVAYSPDGTRVVSGSGDSSIRVWDLATETQLRILQGHTSWVTTVAYSPDGTHIVSGSGDRSIRVWGQSTGDEIRVLKGHTNTVRAVAYSPDGTHVFSGSDDKSIRVWDLSTREQMGVQKGHTDVVNTVVYSPDGTRVVSGSRDGSIRVWDLSTGDEIRVLDGNASCVNAVAYSPDGTRVVSGSSSESIRVWDPSTGEEAKILRGHSRSVNAVSFSPDGTHFVSGSDNESVRVWDLSTGKEVRILKGHTGMVYAVAYSPDGTHVVSGAYDESVRVWNMSTGEQAKIIKGHASTVWAVAYSPDGAHILSCSGHSIRVWDSSTGEELRALTGGAHSFCAAEFSPDGTHIVSGSDDKSIRIWDLSTGDEIRVLKGHTCRVSAVAYSPDGTHVVSCSDDHSVRVWDISPEYAPRYVREMGPDGECTGWLLSPNDPSIRLLFVPPSAQLPDDSNILTLPKSAVPHLDLSNAKLGNRWTECYTPTSP